MTVWLDATVLATMLCVNPKRVTHKARLGQIPGAELHEGQWRFDRDLVEPWAADHVLRREAMRRRTALLADVRDANNRPHP